MSMACGPSLRTADPKALQDIIAALNAQQAEAADVDEAPLWPFGGAPMVPKYGCLWFDM